MTKKSNSEPTTEREEWPECPELAAIAARLFTSLGGTFTIGENGQRYTGNPEPCLFRMLGEALPALPGAQPHEGFLNGDEYRGAVKLLNYVLRRTSQADRDMIFDAIGVVGIHPSKPFDFRDMLK